MSCYRCRNKIYCKFRKGAAGLSAKDVERYYSTKLSKIYPDTNVRNVVYYTDVLTPPPRSLRVHNPDVSSANYENVQNVHFRKPSSDTVSVVSLVPPTADPSYKGTTSDVGTFSTTPGDVTPVHALDSTDILDVVMSDDSDDARENGDDNGGDQNSGFDMICAGAAVRFVGGQKMVLSAMYDISSSDLSSDSFTAESALSYSLSSDSLESLESSSTFSSTLSSTPSYDSSGSAKVDWIST